MQFLSQVRHRGQHEALQVPKDLKYASETYRGKIWSGMLQVKSDCWGTAMTAQKRRLLSPVILSTQNLEHEILMFCDSWVLSPRLLLIELLLKSLVFLFHFPGDGSDDMW